VVDVQARSEAPAAAREDAAARVRRLKSWSFAGSVAAFGAFAALAAGHVIGVTSHGASAAGSASSVPPFGSSQSARTFFGSNGGVSFGQGSGGAGAVAPPAASTAVS